MRKLAGALTILLTACAAPGSMASSITHPSGARELVLQVSTAGGFVPAGWNLTAVPEFTLSGDGRIITTGPQIEIYPGPAMPNVLEQKVSEDGIQMILAAARDAGLFGPNHHYDQPGVADAGTTTFTVVADGRTHEISAYALGIEGSLPATSDDDRRARAALTKFRERLGDLRSWLPENSLGDERAYDFDALRIVVRPASGIPDVTPNEIDWPLDEALTTFGAAVDEQMRCGVVEGADLVPVLARAREATQITRWMNNDRAWSLAFRPQIPGETDCSND
ncbi:MAG: hypothetical protein WDA27_03470 [Actinomycetota bacterium]